MGVSVEGISAIGAIGTLGFGVYQYRLSRILERARFAADLMDKFYKDEDLVMAWNFIDFEGGRVLMPSRYRPEGEVCFIEHDYSKMRKAFGMNSRRDYGEGGREFIDLEASLRTEENLVYVQTLDRLFAFIETVYGYYVSKAIDVRHITHLLFMIDRTAGASEGGERIFEDYLHVYGYWRVFYMLELSKVYQHHRRSYYSLPFMRPVLNFRTNRAVARRVKRGGEIARLKIGGAREVSPVGDD